MVFWRILSCLAGLHLLLLVVVVVAQEATDPVDQAALIAIWNGLTDTGKLGWNTSHSICDENGIWYINSKVSNM